MKATGDVCERCRGAEEESKKEWLRSKFCLANSKQKISGTATGIVRRLGVRGIITQKSLKAA